MTMGLGVLLLVWSGWGQTIEEHTLQRPARPGGVVTIAWEKQAPAKVEVRMGGAKARVVKREERRMTVRVPDRVAEGCYVPVEIVENGRARGDTLSLAVARSGGCKMPEYQPVEGWLTRKTAVAVRLETTEYALETGGKSEALDVAAAFFDGEASMYEPGPLLRFPPPGECAVMDRAYTPGTPQIERLLPLLLDTVSGVELDMGAQLLVDDGRYQMQVPKVVGHTGFYWRNVLAAGADGGPYKMSSALLLRGAGGLGAKLEPAPKLVWRNPPRTPVVNASKPLVVEWESAEEGLLVLAGVAVDAEKARHATTLCVGRRGARQGELRWRMPEGSSGELAGALYLIQFPERAAGFEAGVPVSVLLRIPVVTAKMILKP